MSDHECPKYENQVCCLKKQNASLHSRLEAAEKERDKWKAELDAGLEHFRVVLAERNRLREAKTDTICAYCNVRFKEEGTEQISAHVLVCVKHPMVIKCSALLSELAAMREVVKTAKVMRIYCLGSDVSTENMLKEFDVALAALKGTE